MSEITSIHFTFLAAILFSIGACGIFLNRKNILSLLMSIEIMLLAVNINFTSASVFLGDISGQIMAIFVLSVAGAEAAIGLAILILYFRNRGNIEVTSAPLMKG